MPSKGKIKMIELHVASLYIGIIIGCLIGIAISFFASWKVESERNDRFSDGWDAGIKYHKAIMEKKELDK